MGLGWTIHHSATDDNIDNYDNNVDNYDINTYDNYHAAIDNNYVSTYDYYNDTCAKPVINCTAN